MNTIGQEVPAFEAVATGDKVIKSADLIGRHLVLYFYPRDNTPGCTMEGHDFRKKIKAFETAGAIIFGVSRDGLKSHERFKDKQKYPFDLLVDEDEALCQLFDVIKQKNMFGKKVRGIVRSTFLIDKKGVLQQEWRKVKILGHVAEVLAAVKALG